MTELIIHQDWETKSQIDLTKVGVYNYAMHPSTDVILGTGRPKLNGKRLKLRRWRVGDKCPYLDLADPEDWTIKAWNAAFERLMWNEIMVKMHGWPELELEQFMCTAALARLHGCPGALENAAEFLDRPYKKDNKGHLHMLKMCRPATESQQLKYLKLHPNSTEDRLLWCHHTRENIDRLHKYCDTDVDVEEDIEDTLEPWREEDLEAYWESERINDHGLCIDTEFCEAAVEYAEDEKEYFNERIIQLTDGQITTPRQFVRIKEWALPRMSEDAVAMTVKYEKGEKKHTFDADTRQRLLDKCKEEPGFLDFKIEEFIDILDQAGKSTIAKYESALRWQINTYNDNEERVHGCYVYAGAAGTGRYSSRGIQLHNLSRSVPDEAEDLIDSFINGGENHIRSFGHPIHTLAKLIRPTIWAPEGKYLCWGDWSSIEAMVLPWLSFDPRAQNRLELFAKGEDLYCKTASEILGRTITKEDPERQSYGKTPELSLGYGGSIGAFKAMSKNLGVHLEDNVIERIVKSWREANPWAVDFWSRLENAAIAAIEHPGMEFKAGRIAYSFNPDSLDGIGALWARLPSERSLCYPGAALELVQKPWGEMWGITAMKGAWKPKKGEKEWPRMHVWKGLLCENPSQAVATGDLLNHTLINAWNKYELIICGHTHDELINETENPEKDSKKLKKCMEDLPEWAEGIPVRAEVEYGIRYKVKENDRSICSTLATRLAKDTRT